MMGCDRGFSCQDGLWEQVIQVPDAVTVPLDDLDLSHLSSETQAEALAAAVNTWQASLNLAAGPLFRAALLQLGERDCRLLLIAHHLIVDGVSWRILLEDLETAYRQLAAGKRSPFTGQRPIQFRPGQNQLLTLGRSGYFEAERSYWRDVCAPAAALPVDFEGDAQRNRVASMEEISFGLDADQTQALLEVVTQTYHAQVNEVLLTVLGQTLKSWMQSPTVLIDLGGAWARPEFAKFARPGGAGWVSDSGLVYGGLSPAAGAALGDDGRAAPVGEGAAAQRSPSRCGVWHFALSGCRG